MSVFRIIFNKAIFKNITSTFFTARPQEQEPKLGKSKHVGQPEMKVIVLQIECGKGVHKIRYLSVFSMFQNKTKVSKFQYT
jgi:hypothetical protein